MTAMNNLKSVLLSKEEGQKWSVEFTGRITRRELNVLRRLLPVEYARLGRRRQMKRLQEERAQKLALIESTDKVQVKTSVIKTFLGKTVKIYGCHLQIKPSLRFKMKYKMKQATDFIINSVEYK